jgi:hypothetical protein
MYFVTAIYGGHNFCHRVEQEDIQMCQHVMDHFHGFIERKRMLLSNNGKHLEPLNESLTLYLDFLQMIMEHLQ